MVRYVTLALALSMGVLVVLVISSYLIGSSHIKSEANYASLVDLAGNQETLSQRLAMLSLSLVSTKRPELRGKIAERLRDVVDRLEDSHRRLVKGDPAKGVPSDMSPQIREIYLVAPYELDRVLREYIAEARALLAAPAAELTYDNPHLFKITVLSSTLLEDYGFLTEQYRREGVEGIYQLQKIAFYVLLGTLTVMMLTWFFILSPVLTQLERELRRRTKTRNQLVDSALQLEQYTETVESLNTELEQFAGIVAHDLRGPLHNISGFGSFLREKSLKYNDLEAEEFISYIQKSASRMDRMIRDLLQFSKVTGAERQLSEFPLSGVIDEILSDFSFAIREANASVVVEQLPRVQADRAQLRHLFQNLLQNSLKFRSEDRTPVIRIFEDQSQPVAKGFWRVVVEDNGIGFKTDNLDQVFLMFRRLKTDKEYEGTGVGLAICKKIVLKHGGTIHAENVETGGARFVFTLPLAEAEQSSRELVDPVVSSGSLQQH